MSKKTWLTVATICSLAPLFTMAISAQLNKCNVEWDDYQWLMIYGTLPMLLFTWLGSKVFPKHKMIGLIGLISLAVTTVVSVLGAYRWACPEPNSLEWPFLAILIYSGAALVILVLSAAALFLINKKGLNKPNGVPR